MQNNKADRMDLTKERKMTVKEVTVEKELLAERIAGLDALLIARTNELRLAQQRSRTNESIWSSFINAIPEAAILVDRTGIVVALNSAAAERMNTTESEACGCNVFDLLPPEVARKRQSFAKKVFKSGVPVRFEDKRGDRWIHSSLYPVFDEHGKVSHLAIVGRDITEQKLAEQALLESEKQYRLLFEEGLDAILLGRPDGTIYAANQEAEKLFSMSEAELCLQGRKGIARATEPAYTQFLRQREKAGRFRGEVTLFRGDGSSFQAELSSFVFLDTDGEKRTWNVIRDVSERRRAEVLIRHQAYHDGLTDLPNRRMLIERLEEALAQAKRHMDRVAVIFLDLDGMKQINDRFGHDAGDDLLKAAAHRLTQSVRKGDSVARTTGEDAAAGNVEMVARLGGDEFVIILPRVDGHQGAAKYTKRMLLSLQQPILIKEHEIQITASAGVALYPEDGFEPEALLRRADQAMYQAKEKGRNRFCLAAELNPSPWKKDDE